MSRWDIFRWRTLAGGPPCRQGRQRFPHRAFLSPRPKRVPPFGISDGGGTRNRYLLWGSCPHQAAAGVCRQNRPAAKEKALTKKNLLCYTGSTSKRRFFFCACFSEGGRGEKPQKFFRKTEVPTNNESQNRAGLHRVQAEELQHQEEQEERPRQAGNEQVLQVLPEAHPAQGNQVRSGGHG